MDKHAQLCVEYFFQVPEKRSPQLFYIAMRLGTSSPSKSPYKVHPAEVLLMTGSLFL